jgi:hypothetical protein
MTADSVRSTRGQHSFAARCGLTAIAAGGRDCVRQVRWGGGDALSLTRETSCTDLYQTLAAPLRSATDSLDVTMPRSMRQLQPSPPIVDD